MASWQAAVTALSGRISAEDPLAFNCAALMTPTGRTIAEDPLVWNGFRASKENQRREDPLAWKSFGASRNHGSPTVADTKRISTEDPLAWKSFRASCRTAANTKESVQETRWRGRTLEQAGICQTAANTKESAQKKSTDRHRPTQMQRAEEKIKNCATQHGGVNGPQIQKMKHCATDNNNSSNHDGGFSDADRGKDQEL